MRASSCTLLLKRFVARVLLSKTVSRGMAAVTRRVKRRYGLTINVASPVVPDRLAMAIWARIHESAEVRVLNCVDKGYDAVIDLGASVGILGALAARSLPESGLYLGVEANSAVTPVAEGNVKRNSSCNIEMVHAAIYHGGGAAKFMITPSLTDSVVSSRGVEVPVVTLRLLLDRLRDNDRILLLCDIEGAEWGLVESEAEALRQIDTALFEVHRTDGNGVETFIERLERLGLAVRRRDGNVVLVENRKSQWG
jgi:FkbM family methyltransferase